MAMRNLAVREENTIVVMVMLHNKYRGRDEPICANRAMLRGQASVCKFSTPCVNCEADVDYTETILCDVLCRGLDKSENQLDLLGNKNKTLHYWKCLQIRETKKAVIRSATCLLIPHSADATAGSTYRHQKRETQNGLQRTRYHAHIVERRHMAEMLAPGEA